MLSAGLNTPWVVRIATDLQPLDYLPTFTTAALKPPGVWTLHGCIAPFSETGIYTLMISGLPEIPVIIGEKRF